LVLLLIVSNDKHAKVLFKFLNLAVCVKCAPLKLLKYVLSSFLLFFLVSDLELHSLIFVLGPSQPPLHISCSFICFLGWCCNSAVIQHTYHCNTTVNMDPFTLIGVAANLARVIIHLSYTYKLQQTHIGILVDRITSLEKPLESMYSYYYTFLLKNI
jgi:hypothetical protein